MRSDLQLTAKLYFENMYRLTEREIKYWPRTMSVFLSNLTNDSSLWKENNSTDLLNPPGTLNVYLFCLTCLMTLAALAGSIYSLVSLLKTQNRTVVSMLVASWSGDDLLSVLSVTIFMILQWPNEVFDYFQSLCTTSALLYLCQGLSSNLKATLLVSYNFYTMHRTVGSQAASRRSSQVLGVALTVWAASLLLSALPLCGWGAFVRTPWGCLADCSSSYVLLLFAVYTSAFGLLAGLSVPLIHQLLCSEEPLRLHANYQAISRGTSTPGTPPTGESVPSLCPDDALGPAPHRSAGCSPGSDAVLGPGPTARVEQGREPRRSAAAGAGGCRREDPGTLYGTRSFSVSTAQKRFSLILALTKVILWLPMMVKVQLLTARECVCQTAWVRVGAGAPGLGNHRESASKCISCGFRDALGGRTDASFKIKIGEGARRALGHWILSFPRSVVAKGVHSSHSNPWEYLEKEVVIKKRFIVVSPQSSIVIPFFPPRSCLVRKKRPSQQERLNQEKREKGRDKAAFCLSLHEGSQLEKYQGSTLLWQ